MIIQDSNQIQGRWTLGRITVADASLRDGYVRNVEVEYKSPGSSRFMNVTRPVQRIVVLIPVDDE